MAEPDDDFARTAREIGLLSDEEARACRERLADLRRTDPAATFADAARALGVLTPLQIASIRQLLVDPNAISAEPIEEAGAAPAPADRPAPPSIPLTHSTPPSLRQPSRPTAVIRHPVPDRVFPGGFRPVSWLGRGPHGSVLLAEDAAGARRAIKVVPLADPAAPEVAALLDAWRRLSALDHTGIVPVHEPALEGGELILPSRPMEGISLLRLAERVPLTLERACQIAIDVCAALEAAGKLGLRHGNLKLENVWVHRTHAVAVRDFGPLWRLAAQRGEHDSAVCPLRCLAPELLEGAAPNAATEVYGVGAIVYELATRAPLHAGSCEEVRRSVLETRLPAASARNARIPEPLDAVLAAALARRPEDRYPSTHDLAYDLNAFLHGSTVTARRLGLIARIWSFFGGSAHS